jgi:hypothetical protein
VLSGRGLGDELITHPEESYRLWCVVEYDPENLKNEEAMTHVGSQRHSTKKETIFILGISFMQGIYTYIPETNHVRRDNVLQLFSCSYH